MTIRGRVAQVLSAAIIDQALLSGSSFLVGFILLRFTTDRDYALFVLLQTSLVLVTSIHNALVCRPVAVMAPRRTPELKREMIGAIRSSQNRWLWPVVPVAMAAVALGYFAGVLSKLVALVVGIGVIAGWTEVQRNYARNMLLLYSRARTLLSADGAYFVVLMGGVLWAAFGVGIPAVWVAVTLAAAGGACAVVGNRGLAKDPGWATGGDAGPAWREIRAFSFWAVTGSVIYWIFSRSYNYLLASRLDLTAVANVNAVRLMVMPAVLVGVGLQSTLTPLASTWHAEEGFEKLVRRLVRLTMLIGACYLLYFALLWPSRAWITTRLLHKHITDRDELLLLWMAVSLISLLREILVSALYALGRFKWLAFQIGFCAAAALGIMWITIPFWGAAAVLVVLIIGEAVNVVGILYLVRKTRRRIRLGGTAAACTESMP